MDLLAITSYYNPFRGELRKSNYEVFRRHLGINLLTVEWSRNSDFDLCEKDADHLIQVSNGDLVWQKERLLNIGIAEAKSLGYSKVALLDSDVVFHDPEWFRSVDAALDTCSFVQCFEQVDYLPRADYSGMSREQLISLEPDFSRNTFAYNLLNRGSIFCRADEESSRQSPSTTLVANTGMAIAIRLDGDVRWRLYEGNIVGSGDLVLMAAVTNHLDQLFRIRPFTRAHRESICSWKAEHVPDDIRWGYVENHLAHLWHGEIENRRYLERNAILIECDYDPARDLDAATTGALKLTDRGSDLKRMIAEYMGSREDS